tara:strand:+ start:492 stop:1046 length:555 start_codon:yes stop_codon:yes gene_type:complete
MQLMKIDRYLHLKEYVWNSIKNLTNSFSYLIVNDLGNGYIKCHWDISAIDNFRIDLSKSCFFAIRLFDISNNRNKNNSTCIMKEIQVSKFQSSITFPIPINKGVYYFEFGFRKKNGEWRKLADHEINMGYRILKVLKRFKNDNWFDSKIETVTNNLNFHEKAYQLSLNTSIGGSENVNYEKETI